METKTESHDATSWQGTTYVAGFLHSGWITYKEGESVLLRVQDEFYKEHKRELSWQELATFAVEPRQLEVQRRLELSLRLWVCATFVANPKDSRKKLLVLQVPPEVKKMVRQVKVSQKKKMLLRQEDGKDVESDDMKNARKNEADKLRGQLVRHDNVVFKKTKLELELETYDIDLGVVQVNFVPHTMRAKVFADGSLGFMGRDDFEKVVKVVLSEDRQRELLSGQPQLMRPARLTDRISALSKLLTYSSSKADKRHKMLTAKKRVVAVVRMTRTKQATKRTGRSGRGDRVVITDISRMTAGVAGFRRAVNSRAAQARAQRLWDVVKSNLALVVHLHPGLSAYIDGTFKFNRSLFVGAADLLQTAADGGAEPLLAMPFRFWRHLARSSYEAYRITLAPKFLQQAHVAYKQALSFVANLSSVDVWLGTGLVYVRHGSWKGAASVFARIIQDYPRYDAMNEVVFQAAMVMAHMKLIPQALAYLRAVLGQPPQPYGDEHILMLMAELHGSSGEPEAEEDALQDAFRLVRKRAGGVDKSSGLAVAGAAGGAPPAPRPGSVRPGSRAAVVMSAARREHEHRWAALLQADMGQRGKLRPRRLVVPPHSVLLRMHALDEELGEEAATATTFSEWLEGSHGRVWAKLGLLFAARGDELGALPFFRRALSSLPFEQRTPQLNLAVARCYAAAQDLPTALALAEEAAAAQPELEGVQHCLRAWAPEKYGAVEVGKHLYEQDDRLDTMQMRRQTSLRIIQDKNRQHEHSAAMTIQRVARGRAGRRKVSRVRLEHKSATDIQRTIARGAKGRARAGQVKRRHEAARDIQRTLSRGPSARKVVAELRAERAALESDAAQAAAAAAAEAKAKAKAEAAAAKAARDAKRRAEAEARAKAKAEAAAALKAAREAEDAATRAARLQAEAEEAAARRIQAMVKRHLARGQIALMRSEVRARVKRDELARKEAARVAAEEAKASAARLAKLEEAKSRAEKVARSKERAQAAAEEAAKAEAAREAAKRKEQAAAEAIAQAQAQAKAQMRQLAMAERDRDLQREAAAVKLQAMARAKAARAEVALMRLQRAEDEERERLERVQREAAEQAARAAAEADHQRALALAREMAFSASTQQRAAGGGLVASAQGLGGASSSNGASGLDLFASARAAEASAAYAVLGRAGSPGLPALDGSGRGARGGEASALAALIPPAPLFSPPALLVTRPGEQYSPLDAWGTDEFVSGGREVERQVQQVQQVQQGKAQGKSRLLKSAHAGKRPRRARPAAATPNAKSLHGKGLGSTAPMRRAHSSTQLGHRRGVVGTPPSSRKMNPLAAREGWRSPAQSAVGRSGSRQRQQAKRARAKRDGMGLLVAGEEGRGGLIHDPSVPPSPSFLPSIEAQQAAFGEKQQQLAAGAGGEAGGRRRRSTGSHIEGEAGAVAGAAGTRPRSTGSAIVDHSPLPGTPQTRAGGHEGSTSSSSKAKKEAAKAKAYTRMPSIRHMTFLEEGGDSGEVRWNTLNAARRTGFTESASEPYLRHWRTQLKAASRSLGPAAGSRLRKAFAEVRFAHSSLSNEEAFIALADCSCDVRLATARLVDRRFMEEVRSLARVLDVAGFINGTHRSPAASPTPEQQQQQQGRPVMARGASSGELTSPHRQQLAGQLGLRAQTAPHSGDVGFSFATSPSAAGAVSPSVSRAHMLSPMSRQPVLAVKSPMKARKPRKQESGPRKKFNPRIRPAKKSLTPQQRAKLIAKQRSTADRLAKGHSCNKLDCIECAMRRQSALLPEV